MEFKKELEILKKEIDHEIEVYLDQVIKEAEKTDVFMTSIVKYFKKTILAGGKRIRPIMMYWGYVAAGGKNRAEIIKTSVSIELIHAFLLIHDDIVDRDDFRRGKKTLHAKYRDYHKKFLLGDESDHFGMSIALISGDFVYSLGNQILFSSKFSSDIVLCALNKMQDIVGLTCVGEMQDIYMEYSKNVTNKDILTMYENKTARYTFDGPLKLGAILGGADDIFCEKMSAFAMPIGIAFQVRDDILGIFGDEKKTGKPVGSDISEGKKTLLVNYALKRSSTNQKKKLVSLLGKKDLTQNDIANFQDILIKTGAKSEVDTYVDTLIAQAEDAVRAMLLPQDAQKFLLLLAQHLNNRQH